jgi:[FeFe] hydrogenase H-cluster maturation GTPase HydF
MRTTPKGLRLHIGIFGRRNSGKSSLLNAITNQQVSIVSNVPGTTTDPVEKTMELLPIGPVLFFDTAGLDDEGFLGEKRIEKSRQIINRTDIALLVSDSKNWNKFEENLIKELREKNIPIVAILNKNDINIPSPHIKNALVESKIPFLETSINYPENTAKIKELIIKCLPEKFLQKQTILGDLFSPEDTVVLVTPIDKEAPKGRMILPQVQSIRDVLDNAGSCLVLRETELKKGLQNLKTPPALVVTDSQAFKFVSNIVPENIPLTSFSILFARFKGNLKILAAGTRAIKNLLPGDNILIAEACSHHPIGEDIGRIKIPNWLNKKIGGTLNFEYTQGHDFPKNLKKYKLVIQCGSCVFNRQAVLQRIEKCIEANIPMTNYGLTISYALGIFDRAIKPFNL